MSQLSRGDACPDFDLVAWDPIAKEEIQVTSAGLRGYRFVLVFYPKDSTPGCTTQACALRDGWDELRKRVNLFGVSPDDLSSHNRFASKQNLPYPLLVDNEQALAKAFGVWVEKKMYGKSFMGVQRSTFIVGADGCIEASIPKASPKTHYADLLELLAEMEKAN